MSNGIEQEFDYPAALHDPPLTREQATFPSIIDNSMGADFRVCEERWFRKHCQKLALLDDNVHLVAGGAYARGLEVTRKLHFDHGWPIRPALREGIKAAIEYYGPFEPHGRLTAKNIWRVIGAMEWHFNRWPIDEGIIPFKPEGADRHAIEFSFAEPIPGVEHPETGEPLLYSGKCDFIGIDVDTGVIGPVDDKTTSSLGEYWLNKWDLSSQMFGYIWAARRAGYPATAAFIRGVSILKTKYGDANARTYMSDMMAVRFEKNVTRTVKNMIAAWKRYKAQEEQPFQMAMGGACTDFGGCGFKQLCESDTPEVWVPVNFTVNKWNPLESRD